MADEIQVQHKYRGGRLCHRQHNARTGDVTAWEACDDETQSKFEKAAAKRKGAANPKTRNADGSLKKK